jgi:hypothetical protein
MGARRPRKAHGVGARIGFPPDRRSGLAADPPGAGQLRLRADAETGLLDYDFRDPQAAWSVPARVVADGRVTNLSGQNT